MNRQLYSTCTAALISISSLLLISCKSESAAAPQVAAQASAPVTQSVPPSNPSNPAPAAAPAETPAPSQSKQPPPPPAQSSSAPVSAPATSTVAGLSDVDLHKTFGSKSAPIVMEVFSDFQCPACRQLFITTNRPLMENYVSTGKVFLIHRDFPLQMHQYSRVAARYARAAAQIGKAEQAEQALFQNQDAWQATGDIDGTLAAVLSAAEMTKIRNLVNSGAMDVAIEKDLALGRGYNVNQTPTTIIHSKGQTFPVAGIVTYDVMRQFLEQLSASN